MIFGIAAGAILAIGVIVALFGGRQKSIPPLQDIMINPSNIPDARPYYAQAYRKGGLNLRQAGPKLSDEEKQLARAKEPKLVAKLITYVAEGLKSGDKAKDLIIIERTKEEHANQKLLAALGGGLIFSMFYLIFTFGTSGNFSPVIFFILLVVGVAVGYVLPDSIMKSNAVKLRKEFDEAFYSWLDIVSQYLTTGEEAGTAMIKAAALSKTWPFQLLHSTLSMAQLRTLPIHQGLQILAQERGLDNLSSLRDTLRLSTDHGVELGETLRSYIQAYRAQNTIDAEAKVKSFAEQSALPLGMVVIAFVILIAYPGIAGLTGSFGIGGDFTSIDVSGEAINP